ncbi:TatD family hydrolase [archaeon]|jgi:TatD DNase family protein|nr:TatD family hydrolase [archaeon]
MEYIDIHSHIKMENNLDSVIKNAHEKNVVITTVGVDKKSNRKCLEIKTKNPEVQICLGIYPKHVLEITEEELDSEIEFIRKNKNKIVGISEVGLDLFESEEIEKQKRGFGKFVNLAKELDIPVIVHSRKAEEIAINFLENFEYKKIIMHCFSGNFKLIQRIIDNGWSLSIPTNVVHSEHFQKIISICPLEQLFCETDSPYLHPAKKFPNEPANVVRSYEKIAEIKKLSLEEVRDKIGENWERIFGKS